MPTSKLGTIDTSAKKITDDSLPGVYYISQLKIKALQRYDVLQELVRAGNPADQARLVAEGNELQTALDGLTSAYEKTIHLEEDRAVFDAMKTVRSAYREGVAEAVKYAGPLKNKARAQEITEKQVKPLYQQVTYSLDALVALT